MTVPALVLCLLLALGGAASAQEAAPEPGTDPAAYQEMREALQQAERDLLDLYVTPGQDIPAEAQRQVASLDAQAQAGYFRDLAQRSGMLLFLTQEEARLQEERLQAAAIAERLVRESGAERRRTYVRYAGGGLFWASLGSALFGFASSFGCWYAADRLDQLYLASPSSDRAATLKAWSRLLAGVSYTSAGVGVIGITVALPVLAGMRVR